MALYWCTECIPLAVTALLPVILFPMMGIMESGEVCIQYLKDSNMLFIGGLLVAIAVEQWNLHRRIALQVLLIVGVKPSLLMIGFMSTTAFLSMWISNTASTAMMLPIANAVLQQLCDNEANAEERDRDLAAAKDGLENQGFEMGDTKENMELKTKDSSINMDADKDDDGKDMKEVKQNDVISKVCNRSLEVEQRRLKREQKYVKLSKGMSLSVCYAASIGGTATLTGTTPNVILKGQIDDLRKSFGCGTDKADDKEAYQVIKDEYKKLGRMSFAESCVLVIFTLLVLLWFTREPGFIPGWATVLFNKDKPYVTDGTVAILMSTLFFCIPSNFPRCCRKSEDGAPAEAPSPLLSWDIVHEKMPWNILLLLGGGFALAHGSESIPPFAISILLCLLVAMFTECSSNTATTTLFLPILASMATAIKIHPLYIMFPCTISASLAFMLPVATPPNAIAFSYGNLKVMDMIKDGYDVCFTQQESNAFILRTAAMNRRHSIDGTVSSGSESGQGPVDSDSHFHLYRRHFSDSAVMTAGCLQQCSSPFSCLQEVCSPDTLTHSSSSEVPTSWDQNNGNIQTCQLCLWSLPASSLKVIHPTAHRALSNSILIFMALKNSKSGSLPVSEIYSFMTEHFPYFKTAPDGWKNSVRHNLSLNKCFEKVENKNGNSSRKGCLWALNPAKVEKMQEELHKWRRKDPVTVRRSMARPEDLDRLLGARPNKLRSLPPYINPALCSRPAPIYGTTSSSCTSTQLGSIRRPQYSHIPPPSQQPCYLPPAAAAHPSNSFALYSPCGQQPAAGIPSATGSLNSPMAGRMPPVYDAALQGEYCIGPRSMQDLLLEGDARYDIDMLNPSLTDLPLQGNLWEELQQDSLVSDSQVVSTTIPSTTSSLQDPNVHTSCLQVMPPVSLTSEVATIGRCKAEYEYEDTGHIFEQHGCLNGLHPVVYSGVESLAGYVTSCTSISLI
eukprot:superscaffoldBa00000629_g6178